MSLKLSTFLLFLGLMLTSSGLAYGLVGVAVGVGADCGNAFAKGDGLALTDAGADGCAQARSERQAHTWALIIPGLLGVLLGGSAAARDAGMFRVTPARPLHHDADAPAPLEDWG